MIKHLIIILFFASCSWELDPTLVKKVEDKQLSHEQIKKQYAKACAEEAKLIASLKHVETLVLWKKYNGKMFDASGNIEEVERLGLLVENKIDSLFEVLKESVGLTQR
jgi:uncharacterized protein YprB with RNaseH-like and TPR domain